VVRGGRWGGGVCYALGCSRADGGVTWIILKVIPSWSILLQMRASPVWEAWEINCYINMQGQRWTIELASWNPQAWKRRLWGETEKMPKACNYIVKTCCNAACVYKVRKSEKESPRKKNKKTLIHKRGSTKWKQQGGVYIYIYMHVYPWISMSVEAITDVARCFWSLFVIKETAPTTWGWQGVCHNWGECKRHTNKGQHHHLHPRSGSNAAEPFWET